MEGNPTNEFPRVTEETFDNFFWNLSRFGFKPYLLLTTLFHKEDCDTGNLESDMYFKSESSPSSLLLNYLYLFFKIPSNLMVSLYPPSQVRAGFLPIVFGKFLKNGNNLTSHPKGRQIADENILIKLTG